MAAQGRYDDGGRQTANVVEALSTYACCQYISVS